MWVVALDWNIPIFSILSPAFLLIYYSPPLKNPPQPSFKKGGSLLNPLQPSFRKERSNSILNLIGEKEWVKNILFKILH